MAIGQYIFYEGTLYGTEIARGLDVFKLLPSEFVTSDEINAAANAYPAAGPKGCLIHNNRIPMTWPGSMSGSAP